MSAKTNIFVKNKPVADGVSIFKDRKGRLHQFNPAGIRNAMQCCQICSLAGALECQFALCRYYERNDRQNGYFQQITFPKRA